MAELPEFEDRQLLCTMLLHTAVVAYPTHTFRVAQKWGEALAEEFLAQVKNNIFFSQISNKNKETIFGHLSPNQ